MKLTFGALLLLAGGGFGQGPIRVLGSTASSLAAWRTGPEERCATLRDHSVQGGILSYTVPPGTVTTFYAKP